MFSSFNIPEDVAESLAAVGSFGLAKSTWSTYRTSERQLLHCQKDTKTSMELPLSQSQILIYIDWLIRVRRVKSTTISSYLAGIRQLHLVKGIEPPNIRSAAVRMVLKGKGHMDMDSGKKIRDYSGIWTWATCAGCQHCNHYTNEDYMNIRR